MHGLIEHGVLQLQPVKNDILKGGLYVDVILLRHYNGGLKVGNSGNSALNGRRKSIPIYLYAY